MSVLLLTRTELAILQMRCEGLSSKQIADKLGQFDRCAPDALTTRAKKRNKVKTTYELVYKFATLPYRVTNQGKGKRTNYDIKQSRTSSDA